MILPSLHLVSLMLVLLRMTGLIGCSWTAALLPSALELVLSVLVIGSEWTVRLSARLMLWILGRSDQREHDA